MAARYIGGNDGIMPGRSCLTNVVLRPRLGASLLSGGRTEVSTVVPRQKVTESALGVHDEVHFTSKD